MALSRPERRLRAGLGAAGLDAEPQLVVEGDFDYASGFRAGAQLLELDEPPTEIFAASDQMALGVYEAARKSGRRIPDDLSVVGFDDLPEARWASPPLTTVRQPLEQMGRMAVQTCLRLVGGETVESLHVELATTRRAGERHPTVTNCPRSPARSASLRCSRS